MRFSRGATINNVIPVIVKRKNEYRKTGKPPSREKETVRVGEKKRGKRGARKRGWATGREKNKPIRPKNKEQE